MVVLSTIVHQAGDKGHYLSIIIEILGATPVSSLHSPQNIDNVLIVIEVLQPQMVVLGDADLLESRVELAHLVGGGDAEDGRPVLLLHLAVGQQDVALVHLLPLLAHPALVQDSQVCNTNIVS